MSNTEMLPALSHIKDIRERLLLNQVAVMIGAGFSRNAERKSQNIPLFPTKDELAKGLHVSLPKQYRENASSGGSDLESVATLYETVCGREALDDRIAELIPDADYFPGHLHELLLSLHWSDVFTTNYDTLLEQTRPDINVVLTKSDIPKKTRQPRIVKLHGSFPTHRPFIITKEDYRTYPTKFAPFVNMVQQSMMENVFCLIGFSGYDLNFLNSSGWVRDQLESDAPPIYFCGLNLSTQEIQILKGIKIIPIDLSPWFPESDSHDLDIRYARALEWFLRTLMLGDPDIKMTWPTHPSIDVLKPSDDLPPIPFGPRSLFIHDEPCPDCPALQTRDMEKLCETWRQNRLEYPGWVVAPKNNRETIWRYTEHWIEPVLRSIEKLSPPENLFLLYELNWRLETALIPLFMNWVEKITPIIETFNPYPRLVEIEDAAIRPDNDEYKRLKWKLIGGCWVELVFALAREAREDQDEKRFHLWMDRLEKVVKERTEWQTRWFYEKCLFYLFRFDQEKIRETLENWPTTHDLPFWEVRRASILAELGELEEAEKIAEESLTQIQKPNSTDSSLLSQEGWTMVLLNAIKGNKLGAEKDFVGQYRDRWEKLGTYRYNPFPEIERLELVLNGPHPSPKPEKETKKDFDPGRMTVTYHIQSGWSISGFLPAFAFLRIFEEGAVPMKCGMFNMFSDAVVNSAKWIAPFAPLWSLSSMIRTGKGEELKEWFDRVRIATLTQDEVDHRNHLFINSLTQATRHLEGNMEQIDFAGTSFSQRQVILISEMLSRLCFRFSAGQLDQLFKLTLDMYERPLFRQRYIILHGCVDNLFKRLLYTMPQSDLLQKIPELLSLPIPTEMGFEVSDHQRWSDPFDHIKWLEDTKLDPDFDRSTWIGPIANLVRVVKDGTDVARERAAVRLEKLYEIDGLTSEENEAFGKALWSKINRNTGLPSATRFYDFAFLNIPETEAGIAKENFRKYMLSKDFPRVVQRSTSTGAPPSDYIREWLGGTVPPFPKNEEEEQKLVDWTTDEVTQLLNKASDWWNDEKEGLQDEFINKHSSIADTVKTQFSGLVVELMAEVILPRLADAEEETKTLAGRLLSEMEQLGLCVLSALPMTLFIDPDSYDEIARKLRVGLNSMKEEEVRGSAFGIFRWLVHGSRHCIPAPPEDLLNELVNRVVTRRQPGLDSAIGRLSIIVWRLPDLLNESQMGSLCVALEYLIEETELPKRQDRETISGLRITIPINDRPEYRELAAELAYRLFSQFTSRNKEVPQILIKWKEICQKDPLPEVRKVWR